MQFYTFDWTEKWGSLQNHSAIEWLNKNKNKLKSTSDILSFLNYFNTQPGK
jgi:hypothetical protein